MELESQICKVEREVLNLRKKDISDAQLWEKAVESTHCTELLENRLNVVSIQFMYCILSIILIKYYCL